MMKDCNGEEVKIGTPVCVLTSGNFIFGHVTAINENKATVTPDIGYNTTKPNFRLKKSYTADSASIGIVYNRAKRGHTADSSMIGVVNNPDDVIVNQHGEEIDV